MSKFLKQASRNEEFHESLCESYSEKYFDWKITSLFYIAIHYLKALANKRGIDIGQTHFEIESNVNPDRPHSSMKIKKGAWMDYKSLLQYSRTSRYDGINTDSETFEEIMKIDYENCLIHLNNFKKYCNSQGLEIE